MGKHFFIKKDKKISLSRSLKNVIFGLVLVVTLSFLISTYLIAEKERRDYGLRESESVLRTLSSNVDSDLRKYKELSRIIMTEDRLVTFLRADKDVVDMGMTNDARYGVMDVLNVTEGVDCVMIFREDLIMVCTNRFTYKFDTDLLETDEWRRDIYDANGAVVASLNSNGVATKAGNKNMVTLGRVIYDIDGQRRMGVLLMNLSPVIFDRMLNKLGYNDICIMGSDGSFLAGNKNYADYFSEDFASERIIHKNVRIDGSKVLVSGCQVGDAPIVLIKVSDYGVEGIPFRIIYVLLGLLLIFVLMAMFVGIFIRRNITDPVMDLSASMENNKKSGDLKKIDVEVPSSELDLLKGDYNDLIDHVNNLIETLIDKEKTLQKAEMRVLQEQIKPHFLYNSIETIGFMALDSGADKVHDALETLGSFYRNFLSKGDREIPLSREVQIVKDYLSLQKLRYGDIIEDEYDIAEDTRDFVVPKLILQPLVENSIYHGIRLKGEKGSIKISSRLEGNELHLFVRDTGVGMSEEEIKKLTSTNKENRIQSDTESFGLWGTIERIRIFVGREDIVRIESEIGEYTQIEFIIPG
ncbi:sensor histidine kinase [Butyrivibrio proteoclasticus]|uniref:sensor histidine kinase n=1 Tax=Butyrivibrio proteoclasticus TaxID=43305 RepID=UPI00047E9C40|nr:sensor histidine kinase [Butyrivibrio proteoclasticus]